MNNTKRLLRNLFVVSLFVLLFAALCIIGASAATYADDAAAVEAGAVARVGEAGTGEYYNTLSEAVTACPANGNVTLIADTSFADSITIDKNLTINGKGTATFTGSSSATSDKWLDEAAHAFNVSSAVNFTVTGDVKITSTAAQTVVIHITAAANVTVSGNASLTVTGSNNRSYAIFHTDGLGAVVNIEGNANLAATGGRTVETIRGKFTVNMTGGTVGGAYGLLYCASKVYADGTETAINMSGGTIECSNNPIHLDGVNKGETHKITVKITGGTLKSKSTGSTNGCIRTYSPANVDISISGGTTLTSAGTGIYIEDTALKLEIDHASLTFALWGISINSNSTGTVNLKQTDPAKPTTLTGNGTTGDRRMLRTVDAATITWNISGGTYYAPTGQECMFYGSGAGTSTLKLSGGKFVMNSDNKHFFFTYRKVNVTITGTPTFEGGSNALFCTSGGAVGYTVNGNITAPSGRDIFRAEKGHQTITINGGTLTAGRIVYTTYVTGATGSAAITVNGGTITASNIMVHQVAGVVNLTINGGNITATNHVVEYSHVATAAHPYASSGLTTLNMSSGSLKFGKHLFHANNSSDADLTVVKGTFTCTGTAQDTWMIRRSSAANEYGGDAVSTVEIQGGTFIFQNDIKYGAIVGQSNGTLNLTVSGGTLTTANYGIRVQAGATTNFSITMSGGTISAKTVSGQVGSIIYSNAGNTKITMTGGTLSSDVASTNAINIKSGANATIKLGGTAEIDVPGVMINSQKGDRNTSMKIEITGGTYSGYQIFSMLGCDKLIANENYTCMISVTGGTLTSAHHVFALGGNNNFGQKYKVTWGGNAKAYSASTSNGYFLVFDTNGTLDMEVTGGLVDTGRASLHLNGSGTPTAERPHLAVIKMTGGTIDSADVCVNIKETCMASFTMTGGKLIAGNTAIRNDNVKNSDAAIDTAYASKIVIKGTSSIYAANYGILIQNGGADIEVYSGVHDPKGDFIRIHKGVSAYPSTVNVYGGVFHHTGDVCYNLNPNATVNIHGCSLYHARGLVTNHGKGTPSTLPGSNLTESFSAGAPVMQSGAGLRLATGSNGIRFVSEISGDVLTALRELADEGTEISFGTLVFPAAYLNAYNAYTHDTLPQYLDIKANKGLVDNGNGGYLIRAAIVNIKEANLNREFVGVAYVKYTFEGQTLYRYAAVEELNNARSIKNVARSALLDTKEVADEEYIHASSTSAGKFSKYTAERQATLLAFNPILTNDKVIDLYMITGQSNGSGYSHFGSEFKTDNPKYTAGFGNVYYSGLACSGNGPSPRRQGTLRPGNVVAGLGMTKDYIGAELGLAEALADFYNAETGRYAGIVKYADGGTHISDYIQGSDARQGNWTPPSYQEKYGTTDAQLSGNQYRNFIELMRQTVAYYERNGFTVNLCGMFWMQGCSERNYYDKIPALGNQPEVANPTVDQVNDYYTELFQTLVADTRKDLGALMGIDLSTMPVVAGSISEAFGNLQSDNQTNFVNMQSMMVNDEDYTFLLEDSRYLATGTDAGDTAHYSVDDMVYIGNKLGELFLSIYERNEYIKEPAEEEYLVEMFDGEGNPIAKFTNIAYAINTAPDGATVKLLRDVTLYGPLNVATFATGVTFDGNGYKLNSKSLGHGIKIVGKSTDITFHNVQFNNLRNGVANAYAIYMYEGSTLNITGEASSYESYQHGIILNKNNTTLNVYAGTFKTRYSADHLSALIHSEAQFAYVNIYGGTFHATGKGTALYVHSSAQGSTTENPLKPEGTFNITGGTFNKGANATYTIYNGSTTAALNISGSTLEAGSKGTVYNAGTGTATY